MIPFFALNHTGMFAETDWLTLPKKITPAATEAYESFQLTRKQRLETCNYSTLTVNLDG